MTCVIIILFFFVFTVFLKLTENFLVVGAIFGISSMLLLVGVYQVSTDKSFTVPTINCLFTQKAMYTSLGHKYGLRLHQEHSIYPYMMNQGVKGANKELPS